MSNHSIWQHCSTNNNNTSPQLLFAFNVCTQNDNTGTVLSPFTTLLLQYNELTRLCPIRNETENGKFGKGWQNWHTNGFLKFAQHTHSLRSPSTPSGWLFRFVPFRISLPTLLDHLHIHISTFMLRYAESKQPASSQTSFTNFARKLDGDCTARVSRRPDRHETRSLVLHGGAAAAEKTAINTNGDGDNRSSSHVCWLFVWTTLFDSFFRLSLEFESFLPFRVFERWCTIFGATTTD